MYCTFNGLDTGVFVGNCSDVYIGFCEFSNCSSGVVVENSNFTTVESNVVSGASVVGVSVVDSVNVTVIGNVISGAGYSVCLDDVTGCVNFNSLASASGAFVESCEVNLTNNWWGSNNPDFANIICGNVSVGSWLVLGLDCLVDWSSNCSSGAYDVVVIGDLTRNNFGEDTSREYSLDNVNMSFSSSCGSIDGSALSEDGFVSVNLNCSCGGEACVYVMLDNQTVCSVLYVPGNGSFGVVNNRSGKGYGSIQEAINDNDTVAGDVIVLSEGIFTENVFVYKNVTLFGNGTVYLNPSDESMATVTIFGAGMSFYNLFINSAEDSYAVSDFGVSTSFCNCSFTGSMVGLYMLGAVNASVSNCSFLDCDYGVYAAYCDNLIVNDSSFLDCDYGTFILGNCNLTVGYSNFTGCWIGLDLVKSNNTSLLNSSVCESYLGLEMIDSNSINISSNIFNNNIVGYSVYNSSVCVGDNSFIGNVLVILVVLMILVLFYK